MKPIQIIAVDDERTQLPFTIPVKGRRPLSIKLPRFDFIPDDEFDELTSDIDAVDTDQPLRKYTRAISLVMVKRFVSEKDYKVLESPAVATGQLDQLIALWREHSSVTLGESGASDNSSTESTEAPSDTTSKSDSESDEQTSDEATDGET